MNTQPMHEDLNLSRQGLVGVIELCRPPHNFFDLDLVTRIADAIHQLEDEGCRALVLCAQGNAFCAGADFGDAARRGAQAPSPQRVNPIYEQALRIFGNRRPIVAAIQGPAIGGGLGLALAADFRVACDEARFSANFTRLGIHPGFGLSVTLPTLVGEQAAALLFYTGRRIGGEEAKTLGLVDVLVPQSQLRERALQLAAEMADSAPLAVAALRQTLRMEPLARLQAAVRRESDVQYENFRSQDFIEGVAAMTQRRSPRFEGR